MIGASVVLVSNGLNTARLLVTTKSVPVIPAVIGAVQV